MILNMIRHGLTQGNIEKRYIGRFTDEALCDEGKRQLESVADRYPECDALFISPMKRCIQTAECIYGADGWKACGGAAPVIIDEFAECDFGRFEGHNYAELNGNAEYQHWIDSGGTEDFPGGESICAFKERTVRGYNRMLEYIRKNTDKTENTAGKITINSNKMTMPAINKRITVIAHGGTIMALLEHFESSHEYFKWQVKNGCGYVCEADEKEIRVKEIWT